MKNSRFTETQITRSLMEHESGKSAVDICRELKINKNTFYLWKKKYSGMDSELLRKYKELERENAALKRMAQPYFSARKYIKINIPNKRFVEV